MCMCMCVCVRGLTGEVVIEDAGHHSPLVLYSLYTGSRPRCLLRTARLRTGPIALSSTTFLGNMMAGLMLRAVRGFRLVPAE